MTNTDAIRYVLQDPAYHLALTQTRGGRILRPCFPGNVIKAPSSSSEEVRAQIEDLGDLGESAENILARRPQVIENWICWCLETQSRECRQLKGLKSSRGRVYAQ